MIAFIVERGNRKTGYQQLGIMDANAMFEIVFDIMKFNNWNKKIIRQWQEAQYTYIDYGSHTDFIRYKAAIPAENLEEKEDQ